MSGDKSEVPPEEKDPKEKENEKNLRKSKLKDKETETQTPPPHSTPRHTIILKKSPSDDEPTTLIPDKKKKRRTTAASSPDIKKKSGKLKDSSVPIPAHAELKIIKGPVKGRRLSAGSDDTEVSAGSSLADVGSTGTDYTVDEQNSKLRRSAAYLRRNLRRARAKSALPTIFAIADGIYFLVRFSLFVWYDGVIIGEIDTADVNKSVHDFYCEEKILALQVAWTGLFAWIFYIISTVLLLISVWRLSLKLCYICIILKTTSVVVLFIQLTAYGLNCLSKNFYWQVAIFFVVHLPLQGIEANMVKPFVMTMRRGSAGESTNSSRTKRYHNENDENLHPLHESESKRSLNQSSSRLYVVEDT